MANVCMIVNDEMFVATKLKKPNDLSIVIPVDSLYTRFGFILPTEYNSLSLIDILEGQASHHFTKETTILGCLLTHEGVLYEYYQGAYDEKTSDTGIRRRRVHIGTGVRYVKANSSRTEEQVTMGLHLWEIDRIKELMDIFQILHQCSPGHPPEMTKLSVQNVLAVLRERGLTDPVPPAIQFHDIPERTKE